MRAFTTVAADMEAQLREQAALAQLGEMAAVVAHEVNRGQTWCSPGACQRTTRESAGAGIRSHGSGPG
jgi:C4-dicarboxylate-specific signal transduction histidine kinase